MRILHVLAERGFSGGENQLLATLRFLQRRGHDQVLIADDRARFVPVARELGVEVHLLRFRSNADPLAVFALRRKLRSLHADLLHFTCSRSHKIGALALACGGTRGLPPRVVTRRMDYRIGRTPFHRWAYGGAVQAVVAISTAVRAALLEAGVDPARIHLIHEGVDSAAFASLRDASSRAAARAALGLGPRDLLGVTAASLHRRKAQDVLLRALPAVALPADHRLVWVLAGDGPERASLRDTARGLPEHLEVRIPGKVDDVKPLLAAADLFCLPSRHEGLGVALLEATAAGLPCIATRVGGMRDVIVDGETGLQVEPDSVEGLAQAISTLLADPRLAEQLGAAARRRAREHFDVERMGAATEELYARLVRAAGGSPAAGVGM